MDSEESQGSLMVVNPVILVGNPGCVVSPPSTSNLRIPAGGFKEACKPTKKRMRHKQRTAIRDVNKAEGGDIMKHHVIEAGPSELKDVINALEDLKTSFADETSYKPKKIRKRRKSKKDIDKEEVLNAIVEESPELFEAVRNETRLRRQTVQPFFPNNKEGTHFSKNQLRSKNRKEMEEFEGYLSAVEVELGLQNKTMVAGSIRINPRCYKEAYISSEGEEKDIIIEGLKNRNRALEGDVVVVKINLEDIWKSNGQRTGKVVSISELVHPRRCVGRLPSHIESGSTYVILSPRDPRVPRLKIMFSDPTLPSGYLKAPHLYADFIFLAQIISWDSTGFAQGSIIEEVGKGGDVEVETLAILLENNLDPLPVNPMYKLFFPRTPYTIPEEEIANRLDLRKECIFTIDPATARDLDDAVSVKRLANGNLEVGVHISDVSYFLHPNTLLDQAIQKRATTIYLVQRCYHMLPVELCLLSSLTPGEDKLAFSVFIELTPDAQVVTHRFARSVIHSCAKLAYEHAQMVIDDLDKTFSSEELPGIVNGLVAEDCADVIRELYKLSVILRKRRFECGALRIDQPKLCFHLDPETLTPLNSFIYENKESHRLIEEFMLLANITVAEHIFAAFPDLAFLRHHLMPRLNMMAELQTRMEQFGIHLDISSAGSLHSSMLRYRQPVTDEADVNGWARAIILNNLCAKPMMRANYFCPSEETPEMHHYALNVPCYTHFTSPIRRYADVMVHRLLAASLGLAPEPTWTKQEINRIAKICNLQKQNAKVAGEQSSQLFLALFLKKPVESDAAVLDVKDHSLDVILKDFGITTRVYVDRSKLKVEFNNDDGMAQLYVQWGTDGPVVCYQLFSVVRVQLSCAPDSLKLTACLLPPPSTSEQAN